MQRLKHLDRNSIFAHLNSSMSLLDYGRQRSEIKTALSLTSFPLSWLLGHMRPSVELFEIAAYWNSKRCGLDKLCLRHSLWAALEKPQIKPRASHCCYFASWANVKGAEMVDGRFHLLKGCTSYQTWDVCMDRLFSICWCWYVLISKVCRQKHPRAPTANAQLKLKWLT